MEKVSLIRVPTHKRHESEVANNLLRFCLALFFLIATIGFALWLSASIPNLLLASVHMLVIGLFTGLAGMLVYRVATQHEAVESLLLASVCCILVIIFWGSFSYVLRIIGPTYYMVGVVLLPILTLCPLGLGIYEARQASRPVEVTNAQIKRALGPNFTPKSFGAVAAIKKT